MYVYEGGGEEKHRKRDGERPTDNEREKSLKQKAKKNNAASIPNTSSIFYAVNTVREKIKKRMAS